MSVKMLANLLSLPILIGFQWYS